MILYFFLTTKSGIEKDHDTDLRKQKMIGGSIPKI